MKLKNCIPVLFVKDAKVARDFYVNTLGFKVIMEFGGLNYAFNNGFAVWQIMDGNVIPETLGKENITNPNLASRFELCFETDDIGGVHKKLKENGTKFLHELHTEVYGQRTIRFYDPDGHLIEIGEAMPIFLQRIYEEENRDLEATAKRTYTSVEMLRGILK
ncbi:VOC family protein [Bacteroides sp. 519]|uniref:VOC family protein n=1 Tax=Bacteroides sp. 519 TaxID=2302937 RepID=UPI0013D40C3A|nr:VOC family protein [Bacteroides sp. 519]NDV60399.1 hypothetical protein [Bacteroides sp. 519]